MAHLFTTNPKFTTRYLLTTRSPWNFTHKCVDIALRFAILGRIDEAVEILECADGYVPIAARYVHDPGLYFAFQAADWWPDFTPDEDMEDEDLLRGLEVNTVSIRFGQLLLDHSRDVESLVRDERDLKRVMVFVVKEKEDRGSMRDLVFIEPEGDGKPGISMPFDSVVLFGLHLALKLENKEAMDILVPVIRSDIERFLGRLARYRFLWRVLATGILAPDDEEGKAAITKEFERIRDAIKTRLRNGVQHPFLDHSMKDLVKMLDENTIRNDQEESGGWSAHVRTTINGKPSIRKPGATQKTIDALEERLDVELPDDYKEFLRVSDGMEGMWNGFYPQRFLAPSASVKNSANWTGDNPLLFSLISYTELPDTFDPLWPSLDLKSCVVINVEENGDFLWLVGGMCMRVAKEVLVTQWEEMSEGKAKRWVERVVGDFFGGMEEMVEGRDEEEWGVIYWDRAALQVEVWGSFREWIEGAVVESEFPYVLMDKKDLKI